ncbi:glycosyltransferase family protein [Janibacter terrae]|uniref:glycosyltransferase family protein n=1 Tax=Janibacter terrae TaxID=103817 RepID=UPI0009ECF847|nr:glycosyltransferase [Janibacter terrae]
MIACILDEFSYHSFAPEADLAPLTMDNWLIELTVAQPDLLLVESAWRGHEQTWWNTVHRHGSELQGILAWCKERGIPTAFWNKEDPVHFNTFLSTASLFDAVFTTDLDCVVRYKRELGHPRVHFLPFAAQPATSNPIEVFNRVDGCAFAGAYYERYPERLADLRELSTELAARGRRFDIYDRNHGKEAPGYTFPAEYSRYIVGGNLPPEMLDIPYKGYTTNLNLNSVKQSQSMFARRVFELIASNTLVISNYSRGLRLMFGDLVIATDSGEETRRRLEAIESNPNGNERLRAMALRKVLSEHTYSERLEYIAESVGVNVPPPPSERCALVLREATPESVTQTLQALEAQVHGDWILIAVPEVYGLPSHPKMASADTDTSAVQRARRLGCNYIGTVNPEDWYGPHYLLDIVQSFRWAEVDVVGHAEYFTVTPDGSGVVRRNAGQSYVMSPNISLQRGLVREESLSTDDSSMNALPGSASGFAIGSTQYCRRGQAAQEPILDPVRDLDIDSGRSLSTMREFAAQQCIPSEIEKRYPEIPLERISAELPKATDVFVDLEPSGELLVTSHLGLGSHTYLVSTRDHGLEILPRPDTNGRRTAYLDISTGLAVSFVYYFMGERGNRLGHAFVEPRSNSQIEVPDLTHSVRVGLRVAGSGSATLKSITLGKVDAHPAPLLLRSSDVVLTNVYPTYDNLYRNGFVHSRVRAYLESGKRGDVLRVGPYRTPEFQEFEDVDTGWIGKDVLSLTLAQGQVRRVLVHFLDRSMWNVLRYASDVDKIIVWVHGAEVQPWWRRAYNYATAEDLEAAKPASQDRLDLWREIFDNLPSNMHFVFVSQYFADEVFEDLGIELDDQRYSIIHNPIDTAIFTYEEKPADQRKRVLTVRPYASAKYANDLSVRAVLALKDRPGFEDLEFLFVGDGVLFEETLSPLVGIPNVTLQRGFLTHEAISDLHKQYGIFLTPTRMDAQGVSRDEAMSSGLVPVTSSVAAIPEFVDSDCGFMADSEDHMGLAEAIWTLSSDVELFQRMSQAAASRVRRQTSTEVILPLENRLIWGTPVDKG